MVDIVFGIAVGFGAAFGVALFCAALLAVALIVVLVNYVRLRSRRSADKLAYKKDGEAAELLAQKLVDASNPFVDALVKLVDDLDKEIQVELDSPTEPFFGSDVIADKGTELNGALQTMPAKNRPALNGFVLSDSRYFGALVTVIEGVREGIVKVIEVGEELEKKQKLAGAAGGQPGEEVAAAASLGQSWDLIRHIADRRKQEVLNKEDHIAQEFEKYKDDVRAGKVSAVPPTSEWKTGAIIDGEVQYGHRFNEVITVDNVLERS